ncbi:hypothetical protein JL722_7669 [Aureococcus anophagefferens]|nr:hypothetical protein JL722_7669 [Aureococcus anophagefferens]
MSITCTSCGDVLEPAGFSKNQLRTPKTARCRWCVEQASQQRQQRRARPPPAAKPPPTAATPPPPPPEAELAALAVADPAAAAAREEEAEALAAIFGDEFRPLPPGGAAARYEIALAADRAAVALDVVCGAGYPVDGAPTFAVRAVAARDEKARRALTSVAAAAAAAAPAGEVCVFEVAAAVRDAFGQRPVRFDAASGDDAHAVEIFDGEPVTDRRSTFQAFLAVGVDSLDKAQWAFRAILARNKCGRATHNMRAYRFTDAAGVRRADNDSDGEDGAGEKMAYLLDVLDAERAVVVSRWYGGVHLGPDRFRHIAHCTQKILEAHGHARRDNARKKRS